MKAPTTPARHRWSWPQESRGALNATAAMLPFVLSYGFIAFGVLGAPAAQLGLSAAVTSVVLGGLLLAAFGRLPMPSASPSASSCLVVASGVIVWMRDPALQPGMPGGLAALMALVGLSVAGAGVLQITMGLLRMGRLVRFVPQPVLAGFVNGVAVLIVLSQVASALGIDQGRLAHEGMAALAAWQPAALGLTLATGVLVWAAGRWLPRWPATLLALVLASSAVLLLQAVLGPGAMPAFQRIGPLEATLPLPLALLPLLGGDGAALLARHAAALLSTALLLALIGALESVLNLAAIDLETHHRTDPDRALTSIGAINLVLGCFGALPVVYLRLRALATLAAGGRTVRAMALGSGLLAVAFTLGLPLLALCPKPVVAGVMVMLAWTLVDRWALGLIGLRFQVIAGTRTSGGRAGSPRWWPAGEAADLADLDDTGSVIDRRISLVIVTVVCLVTVVWGFVAGVALGVLLSFALLVRALGRSLVRQRYTAAEIPSRRVYPPALEALLAPARDGIMVLELEGALFFGNAERLDVEVRALLPGARPGPALHTLVLDLRRVSTVDASGAVLLARLRAALAEGGLRLWLAGVAPHDRHVASLRAHGVIGAGGAADAWALHTDADRATEAAERAALAAAGAPPAGAPTALADCELFAGLDSADMARVVPLLRTRELSAGERLFAQGEAADALYVLSAGSISVVDRERRQRFVSFSPGMTFGELALLDGGGRTADAMADEPSTVHALDAAAMAALQREAPVLAAALYRNLALHLATRLRAASSAWRRAAD